MKEGKARNAYRRKNWSRMFRIQRMREEKMSHSRADYTRRGWFQFLYLLIYYGSKSIAMTGGKYLVLKSHKCQYWLLREVFVPWIVAGLSGISLALNNLDQQVAMEIRVWIGLKCFLCLLNSNFQVSFRPDQIFHNCKAWRLENCLKKKESIKQHAIKEGLMDRCLKQKKVYTWNWLDLG